MTTIEAVSGHLPRHAIPIERCLADEGVDAHGIEFHKRIFGNREVRRDPGSSLVDLLLAAVEGLAGLQGDEDRIRYLVYARTIALGPYPDQPLRVIREKLDLHRAATFSVSQQACASGLLAVDLCGRLLAADGDPDARAVVLAGEKTFSPITRLMGPAVLAEGTAAVLVGPGAPGHGTGDPLLGYATITRSEFADPLGTPPELLPRFSEVNHGCLAEVVHTALARAGLGPSDVALVLPHNVNLTGWGRLAQSVGIPEERMFLDHLVAVGHNFCADTFLSYRAAVDQGRLRAGDHYVMTALGAGMTWSAMVFRHHGGPTAPALPPHIRSHSIRPVGTAKQEVSS